MLLKRHIPLLIVIVVGLLTLFGHFINNASVNNFVKNIATEWFDIIASFAIFLGALNMMQLHVQKIVNKKNNWQYSSLAVIGFAFAIFAGFFFRGANFIEINNIKEGKTISVSELIAEEVDEENSNLILNNILTTDGSYKIDKIFITKRNAELFMDKLALYVDDMELKSMDWGAHVQTEGSLFYWMFFKMLNPLSATMFALLAFFVASASYRAFRIRNFEATLLLVAGIILMLGRVPIGSLIPWWIVSIMLVFGFGAILAPFIKERKILFGFVSCGILFMISLGILLGWNHQTPSILSIPAIQGWIFDYPTAAGSRALMIGIGLGIVGTSFRIILGIERSFLGD